MPVICPACDASFRDPPEEVLKTRKLQCGKCEHEWSAPERIQVDAPPIVPQMSEIGGDLTEEAAQETADDPVIEISADLVAQIDAPQPAEPIYVDVEPPLPEPGQWPRIFASMAALTVLLTTAGVFLFKDALMQQFPGTVPIYATAGLAPAPTLTIANVVTVRTQSDGIRKLIVRGEIANVVDRTIPVPPIRLKMRSKSDASLYEWTVAARKPALNAGEISRFTAVASDYPDGAVDVEVSLDKSDPKQ